MKLVILDSGLRATNGHHYNFDSSLKQVAEKEGGECLIYSNRDCQSEIVESLECKPYFQYECYFHFKTIAIDRKINDFIILNNQIYNELINLPVDLINNDNIFLFHTVTERHLAGILRWVDTLPQEGAPKLVIFLMLPSGLKYRNGKISVYNCLTASLYHYAFNQRLKPRQNLHFYGSGETHSADYSWLLGTIIPCHPIFLGSDLSSNEKKYSHVISLNFPQEKTIILYLGDAKLSKGFQYLPAIYKSCNLYLPEYNFIIHINGAEINYPPLDSVTQTLYQLAENHPNLILLKGFLDKSKYYHCLETADLIVVPYNPVVYADKSSGILWECLYYGIPIVLPKNSWLESEAQKERHGFIAFEEFDAKSIADAIHTLVKNLSENKKIAQLVSQSYRQREGIEAVWKLLTNSLVTPVNSLNFAQNVWLTKVRFFLDNEEVTPFSKVINYHQRQEVLPDYTKDAIAFELDSFISLSLPKIPPQANRLYIQGKFNKKNQPINPPRVALNGWYLDFQFQELDDTWEGEARLNIPPQFTHESGEIIIDFASRKPELIVLAFPNSGEDILAETLKTDSHITTGSIIPWWRIDGEHLAALYQQNPDFTTADWNYIYQRTLAFARHCFYQEVESKNPWVEIYADYQPDLSLLLKMFPGARIACLVAEEETIKTSLKDNQNSNWRKQFFAHYNEKPTQTNLLHAWHQWHSQLTTFAQELDVNIHWVKISDFLQFPQTTLEKLYYFFDLPLENINSASLDSLLKTKSLQKTPAKVISREDNLSQRRKDTKKNLLPSPVIQLLGDNLKSDKATIYLLRNLEMDYFDNTAAHHFLKYFDYGDFNIMDYPIPPMSNAPDSQLSSDGRNRLENLVKIQGCNAYSVNHLMAELQVFKDLIKHQFNIQIIHYLQGESGMQYLPVLLHKYRHRQPIPKIIVTYHQSPDILRKLLVPEILQQVDAVQIFTANQYDYFASLLPKEKLFLMPLGVDTEFFHPRNYARRKDGKIHCLTIGDSLPDYDTVYRVAQSLLDSKIVFHILSQNEKNNCTKYPPNVIINDWVDEAELLSLYHHCDLLFLPLKYPTINPTILQALACGLPIVTTDSPAFQDYLSEETSFLIKNHDVESLKNAILSLAQNSHKREKMSQLARIKSTKFAWQNMAKKMQVMYSNILHK